MREILFRGKRLDNGEWIDGLLVFNYSTFFHEHTKAIQHLNKFGTPISEVEVDPATVGQYTGLKDKFGTPVFEGDVVRLANIASQNRVIEFKNGQFSISNTALPIYRIDHFVVIGNIHDNPELLGGEANG